jgi:CTP synthase (UTP-ammonia lyase)
MAADSKKLKYTRDEIDKLLDQVQTNHTDIVNNRTAAETAEANSILRDETLQDNICAEQERAEGRENDIEDKFDKAIEEIDARSDVVAVVGTVTGAKNSLESWKNDKGVALGKITKNDVVKVLKDETDGHKDLTSYYRYNGAAKTDSPVWPDN